MELLTDILAILGWLILGFTAPELLKLRVELLANCLVSISFGLIAASLVLG